MIRECLKDGDTRGVYEMRIIERSRRCDWPKQQWSDTIKANLSWLDLDQNDTGY